MKRKSITGWLIVGAVVAIVMSLGCFEHPTPVPTPTPEPIPPEEVGAIREYIEESQKYPELWYIVSRFEEGGALFWIEETREEASDKVSELKELYEEEKKKKPVSEVRGFTAYIINDGKVITRDVFSEGTAGEQEMERGYDDLRPTCEPTPEPFDDEFTIWKDHKEEVVDVTGIVFSDFRVFQRKKTCEYLFNVTNQNDFEVGAKILLNYTYKGEERRLPEMIGREEWAGGLNLSEPWFTPALKPGETKQIKMPLFPDDNNCSKYSDFQCSVLEMKKITR